MARQNGWQPLKRALASWNEQQGMLVRSVGYAISDDERGVLLVQSRHLTDDPDPMVADALEIPRFAIHAIHELGR